MLKIFEANLPQLLGVRFIVSEFTTADRQRGRIDYKKTSKENLINQGLFYLDCLVDNKGNCTLAAQEALGSEDRINCG